MSKLKFNVLDYILIAILIIVVIAGCFMFKKFNKTKVAAGTPATVVFTIEVKKIDENVAESYRNAVGAHVTYGTTNTDSGEVCDVKITPQKRIARDLINGRYFEDTIPNKYTAEISIRANLNETENSFRGQSEEVRVGMPMPFSGNGIAAPDGYVVSLVKEDK